MFSNKFCSKINFLDIGARDNLEEPWLGLEHNLNFFGFETDPVESQRLKNKFPHRTYFPFGLAKANADFNLFLAKSPGQSSLYPSSKLNKEFETKNWINRETESIVKIPCKTLDSVLSNQQIDAIKIDTQGSEYQILEGATTLLKKELPILFLETWTHPVYEGAPLTHEILSLLYPLGYELWATSYASGWRYKTNLPIALTKKIVQRLIGLNLLLVPNLNIMMTQLSKPQLLSRIEILCVYRFYDSALLIAENLADDKIIKLVNQRIKKEHSKLTMIKRIFKRLLTGRVSYPAIT